MSNDASKQMSALKPNILLNCGILEEYHDKDFNDYYGHPDKWREIEPLVTEWNTRHWNKPNLQIQLDYARANTILNQVSHYCQNIVTAKKKGISLLLAGPNGSGKTLLATSVLKHAIRTGLSVQMTSLGGIIQAYTEGWSSAEKRIRFDEKVKNVDFLLIDDVGKEYQAKNSDLTEIMFDNLIRYRVFRRKPFILTTNTAPADLTSRYGNSLMSLVEGKCLKLKVDGADYRKAIQSKNLWDELTN